MRTLKKTLCLVLCLAMMAGLCVFASADFEDQDKIENTEAVAVLTGLGVIQGDDKGNFNPEGTLTRAEATVIITKVLGAADIKATTDKFTDVTENYWGMPYIAYCVAEEIVAGMGDGTFAPNAKLTGYQWATLLLRTLGYKIEGESWQIDVAKLVKSLDLADGITFVGTEEISRQDAAQMAFNALTVHMVEYVGGTKITAGGVEIVTDAKLQEVTPTTTLADNFGLKAPVVGIITENKGTGSAKTVVAAATLNEDGTAASFGAETAYTIETGLDMIGHVVKVYFKDAKNVYAVVDESEVITVAKAISTAADLKAAFGKNTEEAAETYVFTNYEGAKTSTGYDKTGAAATVGTYVLYAGEIVAQILPTTNEKVLQKVEAYKAPTAKAVGNVTITGVTAAGEFGAKASITLQKVGDEDNEDVIALYDGIKVGDYVYVSKIADNIMTVEAAEVVTASATARNTGAKKVTLDGVSYKYVTTDYSAIALDTVASADLGKTYNFVLNAAGEVAGVYGYTAESKATEYALVLDVAYEAGKEPSLSNGYTTEYAKFTAYVLLANGTKATYTFTAEEATTVDGLKAEMGSTSEPLTVAKNTVIKFAVDGTVFTEVQNYEETATTAAITAKTAKVDDGKYLTATTPIVYQGSDLTKAAKLVNGYAAAEQATAEQAIFVTDAKGVIVIVFVNKAYTGEVKTETNIAYVPANISGSTDAFLDDGTTYYNYTVYVDGEAKTLVSTKNNLSVAAGFISYVLKNDLLDSFVVTASIEGYDSAEGTVGYVDESIIVIGDDQYELNDAVVITDDTANDGDVTLGGTVAANDTVKVLYTDKGVAYIAIVVAAAA